jgi:hypothetical protein
LLFSINSYLVFLSAEVEEAIFAFIPAKIVIKLMAVITERIIIIKFLNILLFIFLILFIDSIKIDFSLNHK